MRGIIDRRRALALFLSWPAVVIAGCGDSDQRKTGTMVKPSEIIERRDELRAKKAEADRKAKESSK